MYDIWKSIAELRQPCLYRPIDTRMIDENGLVRSRILASLDRLFCEHLASGRASFQSPMEPARISPGERFVNISALQKGIRRGDAEGAMRFALQGCQLDSEQVFRRLAVCAVEDVGIGNLAAVGMAFAVMGNRSMRENGAPGELAAFLALQLAISPKSRLACDLLSLTEYDRSLDDLTNELAAAPIATLVRHTLDKKRAHSNRMIAAWLLAGTNRYRGTTMPVISRPRIDLMRVMAGSKMPLAIYYIADRTAGRLSDAMFISAMLMAEMIAAEPAIEMSDVVLSELATIASYPVSALDLHTREGRIAIGRLSREYYPLSKFLKSVSPAMRETAVRHAVFIVEGGRLADQLRFDQANKIESMAHRVELSFPGIDAAEQPAFLSCVKDGMVELDIYRCAAYKTS